MSKLKLVLLLTGTFLFSQSTSFSQDFVSVTKPPKCSSDKAGIFVAVAETADLRKLFLVDGDGESYSLSSERGSVQLVTVSLKDGKNYFTVVGVPNTGRQLTKSDIEIERKSGETKNCGAVAQTSPPTNNVGQIPASTPFVKITQPQPDPVSSSNQIVTINTDYKSLKVPHSDLKGIQVLIKNDGETTTLINPIELSSGTPKSQQDVGFNIRSGTNEVTISLIDKNGKQVEGFVAHTTIRCTTGCSSKPVAKGVSFAFKDITEDNPKAYGREVQLVLSPSFPNSEPYTHYIVEIRGERQTRHETFSISRDDKSPSRPAKASQTISISLEDGKNEITVGVLRADTRGATLESRRDEKIGDTKSILCESCSMSYGGVNTRVIVGLEQVGAVSASGKTQPFLNLFVNYPLTRRRIYTRDGREVNPAIFSIWSDFRLSSTTVQKFADVSNIGGSILGGSPQVSDVVQSFRINVGGDLLVVPEKSLNTFFFKSRSSLSAIFGAGVTSPLVQAERNEDIKVFAIPKVGGNILPAFASAFPEIPDDPSVVNIAFLTPQRDRFLRRYFIGARLKTHFYKNSSELMEMPPASLDLTFGQDEAITRNLRGGVLTFEGFTPLPLPSLDYLYLYGGISTKLGKSRSSTVQPFQLQSASSIDFTNPNNIYYLSADDARLRLQDRDTYFFGVGIDFVRLWKEVRKTSQQEE